MGSINGVGPFGLRAANAADAPGVAACVEAAYAPWVPLLGRKPWPMLQDHAEVIGTEQVIVAEAGGEIAGVLVLVADDEGLLIENVAVLPGWKGRGLGKALLLRAEHEARSAGHACVHLYTNEKMVENIALYARVGYVETRRAEEQGFRRVFMRKGVDGGGV